MKYTPFNTYEIFILTISLLLSMCLHANFMDTKDVVEIHFFLYIALILINLSKSKRFTLYQLWIAAFVFMIWSEMMILSYDAYDARKYAVSIAFLLAANDTLLLGYEFFTTRIKKGMLTKNRVVTRASHIPWMLTIAVAVYLFGVWQSLLQTILGGRGSNLGEITGSGSIWGVIVGTLGLLIPAFSAYYFKYCTKRSVWLSLIWAMPVFTTQLLLGTRFRLLFMIIPYLILLGIVDVRRLNFRKLSILLLFVLLLGSVSGFVKTNRDRSVDDILNGGPSMEGGKKGEPVLAKIADKMSAEGVVYMTELANRYFSNHELRYGQEISFAFYFVIPRSIWPSKPTPVDYWLVRKYENVHDSFSSASGFCGEIRADFGMACFIILFLWGG